MLEGNVLITGGAGFIGRAILARAKREDWPARFTIYSRDEQKQDACRHKFPDAAYVLGDIRDPYILPAVMANQDIVIHAAALKYIPEAEKNVTECISINVAGTQTVIQSILRSQVKTMVFISTDKAVEPLNTYGFTKALGERIMYESSRLYEDRKFVSVRYGNVIGSTGSVVPVFKRFAREKGKIPITDPNMTRFWISADGAIDLVLRAVLDGVSGGISIPTPQAMRIGKLAEVVCPGVPHEIIGKRPGEKMHEKLMSLSECFASSDYPGGHEYHPAYEWRGAPDVMRYELSSEHAEIMPAATFKKLVDEAVVI